MLADCQLVGISSGFPACAGREMICGDKNNPKQDLDVSLTGYD